MDKQNMIKDIVPKSKSYRFFRRYVFNRYTVVFMLFLGWMIFLDNNSFLVIRELNEEIEKYEKQVTYYKAEYQKNNDYYNRLMKDKSEREKYARENYFMKKPNEEIFILVVDSSEVKKETPSKK